VPSARPGAYVYAVGLDNLVLRSADGGSTWRETYRDPGQDLGMLWAASFADARHGWAAGMGSIIATRDGGVSWSTQYSGNRRLRIDDIACTDRRHAWAVGHRNHPTSGPHPTSAVVLATSDGGASWHAQKVPPLDWLRGVAFADSRHGWAVGEDVQGLGGVILATSDGGRHWQVQQRYEWTSFTDVACSDASHVWAVGGPNQYPVSSLGPTPPPMIVATSDGGASWQTQLAANAKTDSDMSAVDFVDSLHGWVVGGGGRGVVLATSDDGQTWRQQAAEDQKAGVFRKYSDISFADAEHGWIVANHRELLATSDGGKTWALVRLPVAAPVLTGVLAFGPGGH
jgi:photosystem II stability/assembly factor-like uncharacterized protein